MLQYARSQGISLVPAIGILAAVSRALSLFASCPQQHMSSQLQQHLGRTLDITLHLLNSMTSYLQGSSTGLGAAIGPSELRRSLGTAFDLQTDQILTEMWNYYTPSDIREPSVQFKQVQLLLQPQDEVVRTTQRVLLADRGSRHEFTCEWFSKPFLDFVRCSDSAMWVNGRAGYGKSVLCGWILESLQSAVDGREYAVVTNAIDPTLPSEANITCVIKALLWQILKCRFMSGKLYEALANLIGIVTTVDAPVQVEKALWDCLEIAIGEIGQPTIMVIDGLSEIDGGETAAAALFQNIIRFVAGNPLVKLLALSRPFPFSPITNLRRRTIEAKDLHKDICRVITDLVPSHSSTPGVEIARRIDHEADGNFFWAILAFRELVAQNFSQQVLRTLPVSLEANVVSKLDFSDPVTCLVLSNSIIATRPLRLVEIEVMSRLDVSNRLLKPQAPDITRTIENACGSVLVIQDGIVLFRHSHLKQALLDVLRFGELLLGPELHADMACRLLLYIRLVLGQRSDLTLKSAPSPALDELFRAHPLLSYALRYWPKHVVASSMFSEPASFKPNSDCLLVFPDTVYAANVEASYWMRDLSIESIQALQLATSLRKEIFGDHEATLQTIAFLAEALRYKKDFTGAANCYYTASEIAQQALPEFHPFTVTCMQRFLNVIDVADDIDLPSQKAGVLRYLISMHDKHIGPNSDQALKFSNILATHYTSMQEFTLSTDLYQRIHQLTVDRHGKDSDHAKVSAEKFVTALEYHSEEGTHRYDDSVYVDILQTYDVTDARRIKALITKAEAYRSLGDTFNAEIVYVSLWHGVAEVCRRERNLENHEKLLRCGITYSAFLREYGRVSDAQNVLLGLWAQQQALGYNSHTVSASLVEIAMEMKHSGLQDLALDVLYTVLASTGTQNTDQITDQNTDPVEKAISDITLDVVRDAQSGSSSESVLRRILETKKIRGLTLADAPFVNALITKLTDSKDVVAVATEALHQLWPSVMDDPLDRTLCDSSPLESELVQLTTKLARAYMGINQMDWAGRVYWRLFQATRQADKVDDSNAVEYADSALAAFEKTGQVDRMITVREELLDLCVTRLGERHSKTIEARYALASLYSKEQLFDKAKQQYVRITDHLKQPTFHEFAALPALRDLIDIYSRQNCWYQTIEVYASLWKTFLTKGPEYGFDPCTSKALYGDYTAIIKKKDPADIDAIHGITEQYRTACTALWGERNSLTLEAVLWLAEVESSLQSDSIKPVRLYEDLVDGQEEIPPGQREDAKAIIEAAEDRLTDFYQASINEDGQNTPKAVHLQKNIARAVLLQRKRYQMDKTRWGASQPTTLSTLCILVSMLTKQNTQNAKSVALQELQLAVDSLMESDVQPSSLYNAAVILATSYSANGFVEEGLNAVRGLTEHVIFEDDARRSNLVFLTAFEAHLTDLAANFAEIHAKLLKMSALWGCYRQVSQERTDPGLTLACGARIRKFLQDHNYGDRVTMVEDDLYDRFMEDYGGAFAQGIQTARTFFSALLDELDSETLQIETPDIPTLAFAALFNNAGGLLDDGQYTTALNLLVPGFEFFFFVGASASSNDSVLKNGLRLGMMLAVPVEDQDTHTKMTVLSKTILRETLRQCRSKSFDFNIFPIDQISRIASVLGLQQNYEDLEVSDHLVDPGFDVEVLTAVQQWLLTRLWLSRKNLTSLQQDIIIRIGRRLVEVRYFHGHVDSAIELGEDILYNVQRVYGTSHTSTVDIAILLSTMYTATGDQAAAEAVIGNAHVEKHTGKEPNREYKLHLNKRNHDVRAVPEVLEAPNDWGFLDRNEE